MTILEALRKTVESIEEWADAKFLKSVNGKTGDVTLTADDVGVYVDANEPVDADDGDIWIDTANDPSIIPIDSPVQSVNGKIGKVTLTADDVGVYVEANEPTNATDGDIWIDTANDPNITPTDSFVQSVNGKTGTVVINTLPDVTTSDNGKVLMVVNGAWQVVDLNISIDTNGVVSV